MAVTVRQWRCVNPECGHILADVIEVHSGWFERRCRKCGRDALVGEAKQGGGDQVDVKCQPRGMHKLGEASADWSGRFETYCDRCKTDSVIVST